MKAAIKAMLPSPLLAYLQGQKKNYTLNRFHAQWDRASRLPASREPPAVVHKLIIFPSDPDTITGAVGDDAMITATVAHFGAQNPDLEVHVFCREGRAEQIVRAKGFIPVVIPPLSSFPTAIAAILRDGDYDAIVVLGADMMDGYYGIFFTAGVIAASDLAARAGMRAVILGFSFNDAPAPELAACFARLHKRVALNLRDETSLERLAGFAPVRPRLVADSAFTLVPGALDADTADWIEARRAEGCRVIGVNLHPWLFRHASASAIDTMVEEAAEAIAEVSRKQKIAWLLLPHDYRESMGIADGICLRPLYARLQETPRIVSRYFDGEHRAATLKAVAGRLDGVITGRMHLAIASLGMGVPTLCLAYQGKFEGLYRHFGLPREYLLPPSVFEARGALLGTMERFLAELPELTATVADERERVLALAAQNFAGLEA